MFNEYIKYIDTNLYMYMCIEIETRVYEKFEQVYFNEKNICFI